MGLDVTEARPTPRTPSRWTRLRRKARLPDDPAARVLLVNALVNSMGSGMFLTGSVLFYTRFIGMSAGQMAWGLAIAGAVGLVGTLPGGALTDRFGARRMLIALHLVRAVCFVALGMSHNFVSFVVLISIIELANGCSPAASESMVADLFTKDDRVKRLALIHAARNVGLSGGAVLGGLAITLGGEFGFRALAFVNALTFVLTAISVARLARFEHQRKAAAASHAEEWEDGLQHARMTVAFVLTALVASTVMLSDSVLLIALPLWIADHTEAPLGLVGSILVLNTLLTAVIQVPITRFTNPFPKAVRALFPGGLLLAVSFVGFGLSGQAGALLASLLILVGVLILTAAENLQSASSWQIRYDLSPASARARFLSVFSLGEKLEAVYGPPLVTALAVGLGMAGWSVLAVLSAVFPLVLATLARHTFSAQRPAPMP